MPVEMVGFMILLSMLSMIVGAILTAVTGKNYASAGIVPIGSFYLVMAVGTFDKKAPDFRLAFFLFLSGLLIFLASYIIAVIHKNRRYEAN